MSDRVLISVADGIADVRLNRPDKRNALDREQFASIAEAGEQLKAETGVRVVVLSGAGESFCAGLDFSIFGEMAGGQATGADRDRGNPGAISAGRITHLGQQICWVWQELAVPVIAAVHGHALGGGLQLALGADIRICSEDASFGIPAAKLGVGYPYEATSTLVALVGPGQAAEILFTGRRMDAREAERIGLVNRVVASDALEDEVFTMAREIARNAPLSHDAHQRSIHAAVSGRDDEQPDVDDAIAAAWASDDFREGATAFLERRDPQFRGH